MKTTGIGLDLIEIKRFRPLLKPRGGAGLKRLFTERERAYCLTYRDPAPHLAGLFAAKEAASKALGTTSYPFLSLEIRHAKTGAPQVWCRGRRLAVLVSITHIDQMAAAVALV